MKQIKLFLLSLVILCLSATVVMSLPDYYQGDISIYAGSSLSVPPNIMLLFDISKIMSEAGQAIEFNKDIDYIKLYEEKGYTSKYKINSVYEINNGVTKNNPAFTIDVSDPDKKITYISCDSSRVDLENFGSWFGTLDTKDGSCLPASGGGHTMWVTGNYASLTYELSQLSLDPWVKEKEYIVGDVVSVSISGEVYNFICVTAGVSSQTEPIWNVDSQNVQDGTVIWEPARSALAVASSVLKSIATTLGGGVRLGVSVLNENNQGADILLPMITPTDENMTTFNKAMDDLASTNVKGNHWQVNEALWDVGMYFNGTTSQAISSKVKNVSFSPPVQYWCQPNHVVLVTSGLDGGTSQTKNLVPDLVKVNEQGIIDPQGSSLDVAKYLYENLDATYLGAENSISVQTHVVQLFSAQLAELVSTANYGRGNYYSLSSAQQLAAILGDLILGLLEVDSSFIAPVVPASPENQAYSGERIYLGFFKPMNDEPWCGNIKKFGLDSQNRMWGFDSTGKKVSAVDMDGNFRVDNSGSPVVGSFWPRVLLDGGEVDLGGVGEQLLTATRTIYTLNSSKNRIPFNSVNVNKEMLSVASDDEAKKLVGFVEGLDTFGENPEGDPTGAKRRWLKGDIMHSKPVVLSYNYYDFSEENEVKEAENKTYIFVGGNDGMLHAYKDIDGSEAWAFIPPEFLPQLQHLRDDQRHFYYVDGSPIIYVHDKNDDNNIDAADGDKAIIIFGMRRGGGHSTLSSGNGGSGVSTYYALDITDPDDPVYLWHINRSTPGFGEMGQAWSLPTPAKVRICENVLDAEDSEKIVGETCETKIVAVIGGGYDTNEDTRYGATQSFPDNENVITSASFNGEGAGTSLDGETQLSPEGRGVYIVEIAVVDDSGVDISNSGSLVWRVTYGPSSGKDTDGYPKEPQMKFSFPSDSLVVDNNYDEFADTVYIGDTGGQLWRLDIRSGNTDKWNATRIFVANEGNSPITDIGRKIFYKPTATVDGHDTFIFFGTGDREHPLNTAVVDRFYMIRDRRVPFYITDPNIFDEYSTKYSILNYSSPIEETNLVDVTGNELQDGNLTDEQAKTLRAKLAPPYFSDGNTTYYGWYIKLDENNHDGEKILSSPRVFDGKVYFTTYQPTAHTQDDDPCVGVLGPARLYIVDAFTGEAVFNLYKGNDEEDGTPVLERRDRYFVVGRGIASEPIVRVDKQGKVSVMVGRGGGFFNSVENPDVDLGTFDPLYPIYWMKW